MRIPNTKQVYESFMVRMCERDRVLLSLCGVESHDVIFLEFLTKDFITSKDGWFGTRRMFYLTSFHRERHPSSGERGRVESVGCGEIRATLAVFPFSACSGSLCFINLCASSEHPSIP